MNMLLNRRDFLLSSAGFAAASILHMPAFAAGEPNTTTGTKGIIAIDKRGATVRFLDAQTYAEVSNIAVETAPHEVTVTPDHKTAYVSIYGDGVYAKNPNPGKLVLVIDLETRKVVDKIDVSPWLAPHAVMVDNAGMLYVTCDESRKLLVINPKTKAIEDAIDTVGTGHFAVMLPDASKIYVPNKNDKPFVSVIDLKTRKMIGKVDAPNGSDGATVSPDGKRVLATDIKAPQIFSIDTATDTVAETIILPGDAPAFRARHTLDGKHVMVSRRGNEVMVLDAAKPNEIQHSFQVEAGPMGFGFAPDGKTVLVGNHGAGKITVFDISGTPKITRVFDMGVGVETLAFY